MTHWQRQRDIEEVTKDGVRKVICDHVRAGNTDTAKTMSRLVDDIATAAREKLEVAFSIRRPRK